VVTHEYEKRFAQFLAGKEAKPRTLSDQIISFLAREAKTASAIANGLRSSSAPGVIITETKILRELGELKKNNRVESSSRNGTVYWQLKKPEPNQKHDSLPLAE
jgi:hypothetical protein